LIIENGIVIKRILGEYKEICKEVNCIDLRKYGITLPGFIDIHTHLRGLRLEYKEDERSGSMAAAKGGFTAIVDMPNTLPEINNVNALKLKLEKLALHSYVNYGIYVSPSNEPNELNNMLKYDGVVGVKIFPKDLKYLQRTLDVVRKIKNSNKIIIIHAEHPAGIDECEAGSRWRCRPIELEIMFLNYMERYIRKKDRIHITHVTNPLTLTYAKRLHFTIDTCPHYLYLNALDEYKHGCIAKVSPPLRTETTRRILINMLQHFDAISTDHAPHHINEKIDLFENCPSGIASIDFAASLILNLIHLNIINLNDVIRLLSLGPAKILGLTRRWGCFEKGCIANYTIVDPYKEVLIKSSETFSKAKYSPYEDMKIRGAVTGTIIGGSIVYLDGEIIEKPNAIPLTKFIGD